MGNTTSCHSIKDMGSHVVFSLLLLSLAKERSEENVAVTQTYSEMFVSISLHLGFSELSEA